MYVKVTMLQTAAGPKWVLIAGKTYRLPREDAETLIDAKAAVRARQDAVVMKLPATPDPGDIKGGEGHDDEEDAE